MRDHGAREVSGKTVNREEEKPGKHYKPKTLDDARKVHISYVLGLVRGNEHEAARLLDVTPGELHKLMHRLGIKDAVDDMEEG